ncbi:hypothetical protein D3C87_2093910 [compost metagenome]
MAMVMMKSAPPQYSFWTSTWTPSDLRREAAIWASARSAKRAISFRLMQGLRAEA